MGYACARVTCQLYGGSSHEAVYAGFSHDRAALSIRQYEASALTYRS
jgi:hypothetical protein